MTSLDKYFETLELPPGASLEQIRLAYRDLAQIWHPDRFAHDLRLQSKAEERFKAINEAYHKLAYGHTEPRSSIDTEAPSRSQHADESYIHETPSMSTSSISGTGPQHKKPWGWTIATLFSFALICTCYNATRNSTHKTYPLQTYKPTLSSSVATLQASEPTAAPSFQPPPRLEKMSLLPTPLPSPRLAVSPNKAEPDIIEAISTPSSYEGMSTPNLSLPNSRVLPVREFQQIEVVFSSPGPVARGTLRNNTGWFITGGSVVVGRQYDQIITDVLIVDSPPGDSHRFDLRILEGVIPPFTTAAIEIDIGHYLDPYEDGRVSRNPPVRFRARSRVTVDSVQGYPQ